MVLRPKKLSGRKINSPPHYHVYSRMKEVSLSLFLMLSPSQRLGGREEGFFSTTITLPGKRINF